MERQSREVARRKGETDQQLAELVGEAKRRDSLGNEALLIRAMQVRITELQRGLGAEGAIARASQAEPPTIDASRRARAVLGGPPDPGQGPGGSTRRSHDVTFRLCGSWPPTSAASCEAAGLEDVARRLWRLNPRWFSVPDMPVVDRAGKLA